MVEVVPRREVLSFPFPAYTTTAPELHRCVARSQDSNAYSAF